MGGVGSGRYKAIVAGQVNARLTQALTCACGQTKTYNATQCRVCSDAQRRASITRTCEHCHQSFARKAKGSTAHDAHRFCSKRCAGAFRTAIKTARKAALLEMRRIASRRTCTICGKPFSGSPTRKMCSDECCMESARRQYRAQVERRAKLTRKCKACGSTFTTRFAFKKTCFCSKRCAKRWGNRGKPRSSEARARRLGVTCEYGIVREEIFARDGWRCQLCGCSTPKRLNGTNHDRAPELDHIIPFGKRGPHTRANVQCSCRKCNGEKGARELGQLRLM